MKNLQIILLIPVVACIGFNGWSQGSDDFRPLMPVKELLQPSFGPNIMMYDAPAEDQRQVHLSATSPGILYAIYTTGHTLQLMFSGDHGETWMPGDAISFPSLEMVSADIIADGNDPFIRRIYVATITRDPGNNHHFLHIYLFNGGGGYVETLYGEASTYAIPDVALATDFLYPALGSSPYSIGVLLPKHTPSHDSLIFICSADGGETFGIRHLIMTTIGYLSHVSLDYLRSYTYINGRYFAAWDERDYWTEQLGHIFTAHSQPYFDSPWTTPLILDNIPPNSLNKCRRPSIACMGGNTDNDLGNATAIILFERDLTETGNLMDIIGVYNREAANTTNWEAMQMAVTVASNLMPDITYDPWGNRFHATYFDTLMESLLYCRQEQNLPQPSTGWYYVSYQYNDQPDLTAPWPQVQVDPGTNGAMFAWIRDRTGGNGAAMFDAEFHGVGIRETIHGENSITIFPNPACDRITISGCSGPVTLMLYDVSGRLVFQRSLMPEEDQADISQVAQGLYWLRIFGNETSLIKPLVIQ